MKINIGDNVKFLNDTGGGKVTKIIDNKTVMVETEDGFDFPFPVKELLRVDNASEDNFFKTKANQKKEISEEKNEKNTDLDKIKDTNEKIIKKENEEVNIYLSFVPENQNNPQNSKQEIKLINDSNWNLLYVFQIRKIKNFENFPGKLQANYIENLQTLTLEQISEIKEIIIQIIFYRDYPYDFKAPIYKRIILKPFKFFKHQRYTKNELLDQKNICFTIIEENPLAQAMNKLKNEDFKKVYEQKEIENKKINKPKTFINKQKKDIKEIDLHINSLLDNTKGMQAKDMLDYQMKKFNEELEAAKKSKKIKKIVFIHGKGNGRLRTDIRSFLDRNKISYQDASFKKYGYGATLVFV